MLTVAANPAGTTLDNTPAATSLANAIVLDPSANLTVAGSNPLALAGAISGDGALTKNGASTLILTADNGYAGGTTINSGTLQVGNGGATGSIGTGPVLDEGGLVFNRSGIVTVPGAITGTGSLTQMGVAGATLVLTGANTYAGGTTIASGILQLGDGGSTGGIVGDVTNNGMLAFDRADTVTFAGVISGVGALEQFGSGTTILTADNPYTGGARRQRRYAWRSATSLIRLPPCLAADRLPWRRAAHWEVTAASPERWSTAESLRAGSATPGFIGSPTGTFTINGNLLNQGAIQLASGESIGNVLEVHGAYVGAGGGMSINTFLGGDGSPSDRLVINGDPAATGSTSCTSPMSADQGSGNDSQWHSGRECDQRGDDGAWRVHPFSWRIARRRFRLSICSAAASPAAPTTGSCAPTSSSRRRWGRCRACADPPVPADPPPDPLPPRPRSSGRNSPPMGWCSLWPANWGSHPRHARRPGRRHLRAGWLRRGGARARATGVDLPTQQVGLPTKKAAAAPCPLFSPSAWGRFFGQTIDNHYQAFADPRANGNMGGFQGGIDLLRGSLIAGHYERAGLYGAYGDVQRRRERPRHQSGGDRLCPHPHWIDEP